MSVAIHHSSKSVRATPLDTVVADAERLRATAVTAWPDGPTRLTLRLATPTGPLVGRWHHTEAEAVQHAEPGTIRSGRIAVHPAGLDGRLPALAGDVAAGAELISHRVGKRAVVRRGETYRKFVRPRRVAALIEATRRTADLPVRSPRLLEADDQSVTMAALSGRSLHDLIRSGAATGSQLRAVGEAIAVLHQAPLPADLPVHTAADEESVTAHWEAQAHRWGWLGPLSRGATSQPPPPARAAVLHRDLHDKQILLDGLRVGVLDFDLACAGDPALDLANLLEHLRLRHHQGHLNSAAALSAALIDGYRPDARTRAALPYYRRLARSRLTGVYHFRPTIGTPQPT